MARAKVTYTEPGTVVHGYALKDEKAVFCSFSLSGYYYNLSRAEAVVRRDYDNTFNAQSLDHFKTRYEMSTEEFVKVASVVDVQEKKGSVNV